MNISLRRRQMMSVGGTDPYIDWLKSLGCVVWLPLSKEGDLQDRISGNSLVLTGKGSFTWDSSKNKYKVTTANTYYANNVGVAKLSDGIVISNFQENKSTTLVCFETISTSGYFPATMIAVSTNVGGKKPCLAPAYNFTGNIQTYPSGELKLARYTGGTDTRVCYCNGEIVATANAYADYNPLNWNPINTDLNIGAIRENSAADYFNKEYYIKDIYIFNTKLTLEQIRKIQGYAPYDAEIEYLESSGTQYIDTGVPATYDLTEMETTILFKDTRALGRFLAAIYILEDSSPRCYLLERQNNPIGIRATNQNDKTFQSSKAIVVSASDNEFITVTSSISQSQVVLGSQTFNNSTSGADGSNNYYMYCLNSNGNATSYVKCQCKYCKIKKNNILVRDFIPVRVGQVGYMYDKVSGQLFGNQGTGNFTLGPDK